MLVLVLLAVLALVLAMRRYRRSSRVVVVLGGVLFFAVGYGPLPDALLRRLQAGYSAEPLQAWQPRTAIIVLGGGLARVADSATLQISLPSYGRVLKGLELYLQCKHAGKACVVITSGGDPVGAGVSEAKVYGDALLAAGSIPPTWCSKGAA